MDGDIWGIQLYKQQRWDEAIEVLQRVVDMHEGIYSAKMYFQRILDLKSNPPPADWDGVYVMETK